MTINLETYSIVWLDSSSNYETDHNSEVKQRLRSIINYVRTFDDTELCDEYLTRMQADDERIVLIVGGQLSKEIVPRIHDLKQVCAIYIHCGDKSTTRQWSTQYAKVTAEVNIVDEW